MSKFYVYILHSETGRLYIGSTQDVVTRVSRHNSGLVKSTKAYKPWRLLESRSYPSRAEAMKKEKFYKSGQQREEIKKRHNLL